MPKRIDTAAATANGDHLTRNHAVSSLRSVVSADLKNAAPHTTPKTAQPQLYVIYILSRRRGTDVAGMLLLLFFSSILADHHRFEPSITLKCLGLE